jgi:transmembrane sensor
VRFADGSSAELLDREADVRIEHDGPDGVVAELTGSARFVVTHSPSRTFDVRSGDVRVRVLGTTFSVQKLANGRARVVVERGRVEVAWMGGASVLKAGQDGVFPPPAGLVAAPDEPPAETAPPGGHGSDAEADSQGEPIAQGWRYYALRGEYHKAYAALGRGADAVREDPADLMLAADVARLSSHPEQAVAPLRKVCDRFPRDRRAPVAAFTLGRVLLDDLGRAAEAADAFHRARSLWPSGPLVEDALAREVEAWGRAGRAERARTAAELYLQRHPAGRHAADMRKTLGP